MPIKTLKIEVYVNEKDVDKKNAYYETIRNWNKQCSKAANFVISGLYLLQQNNELNNILNPDAHTKLKNNAVDATGILETSLDNAMYRALSEKYKGDVKMSIMSSVNRNVTKNFKKEIVDVSKGLRSLRSYRNTMPMPFGSKDTTNFARNEDGRNFTFDFFNIPMATRLGIDKSNNQDVLERIFVNSTGRVISPRTEDNDNGSGYKYADSSFQFEDITDKKTGKKRKKLFWLMVVKYPVVQLPLQKEKVLEASLDVKVPILARVKGEGADKTYTIGGPEFVAMRLYIQNQLRAAQQQAQTNRGGQGPTKKMAKVFQYHAKEKRKVGYWLHVYSKQLVDLAKKHQCGKIVLLDQQQKEEDAKEAFAIGEQFVLRNWSYFELKNLIQYKAAVVGIDMVVEPVKQQK